MLCLPARATGRLTQVRGNEPCFFGDWESKELYKSAMNSCVVHLEGSHLPTGLSVCVSVSFLSVWLYDVAIYMM